MQFVVAMTIFMVGVYLMVHLRGLPLYAVFALRRGGGQTGALSPFAALSSALCGTLGVGSVIAVVSALAQGGPGVLVTLWVGALTGCALKYAEIAVTMRHRQGALSGAMVALSEKSRFLGGLYALLCLPVALLGMGNLTQVQVLSETLERAAGLPRPLVGCAVAAALLLLLAGGIGRIGRVASVCLPVVGGVYVALCLWALWRLRDALPGVLAQVISSGFRPNAALFTLGVARGLFISEAGMGTAAFAHSQSRAQPHVQATLGVCEVLFSTALCTLTALVVLACGVPVRGGAVQVALSAFTAALGGAGSALLCVMLTFFALSTLPVWWFYGKQCVAFLCGKKAILRIYTALFLLTALAGCLAPLGAVWAFADVFNLMLALPCLIMLLLYRKEIAP